MTASIKLRFVRSSRGCFWRATDPDGMILATADTESECREKAIRQLEVLAALAEKEPKP